MTRMQLLWLTEVRPAQGRGMGGGAVGVGARVAGWAQALRGKGAAGVPARGAGKSDGSRPPFLESDAALVNDSDAALVNDSDAALVADSDAALVADSDAALVADSDAALVVTLVADSDIICDQSEPRTGLVIRTETACMCVGHVVVTAAH